MNKTSTKPLQTTGNPSDADSASALQSSNNEILPAKTEEVLSPKFNEFESHFITDWKRVRSQIEHEDNLVNHRITWLLASNAFLLTGYVLAIANLKEELLVEAKELLRLCLYAIPIVGVFISIVIIQTVSQAFGQINILASWWEREIGDSLDHPRLIGGNQFHGEKGWLGFFFYTTLWIPLMLICLWFFLLYLVTKNLVPLVPPELWLLVGIGLLTIFVCAFSYRKGFKNA